MWDLATLLAEPRRVAEVPEADLEDLLLDLQRQLFHMQRVALVVVHRLLDLDQPVPIPDDPD